MSIAVMTIIAVLIIAVPIVWDVARRDRDW
jgi:hypothetical protein